MQQTSAVRSSIASSKRSVAIVPSALRQDVDDLGAAQLLRVGDLADRRELELGDDDASPLAALERERADDRVDRLRHGGRDGDVVRRRVHEAGEGGPRGLGALDPVLPLGAVGVPSVQVLLVGARGRPRRALPASTS